MKKKIIYGLIIILVLILGVVIITVMVPRKDENPSADEDSQQTASPYVEYQNIVGMGKDGYTNPSTGEKESYYGDTAIGDVNWSSEQELYYGLVKIDNPNILQKRVDETSPKNIIVPRVVDALEYYLGMYLEHYLDIKENDTLTVTFDSYLESNIMPTFYVTVHYYDERDIEVMCLWYQTVSTEYFIFDSELAPLSDAKPQYTYEDIFGK